MRNLAKEGRDAMSVELFMSVISMLLTAICLGYMIGKDINEKQK